MVFLSDKYICKTISAEVCLPLRHKILWPAQSLSFSAVEGDDQAHHFGLFLDKDLLSCLSLFRVDEQKECIQLRKFCTDTFYQSKGLGSHLLRFALEKSKKVTMRWVFAHSRLSALPFYLKNGFRTEGNIFLRHDLEYIKVIKPLE